jgi:hypothetical protein
MMANGGSDQNRSIEKQVHRSGPDNASGVILTDLFDGLCEIDWASRDPLVNPDSIFTDEARALRQGFQNQPFRTVANLEIRSRS